MTKRQEVIIKEIDELIKYNESLLKDINIISELNIKELIDKQKNDVIRLKDLKLLLFLEFYKKE